MSHKCHTKFVVQTPKRKRAAGARVPFEYTASLKSKDKDGNTVIKSKARWKQQIYFGYYPDGRRRKRTFTADTSGAVTKKAQAWRKDMRGNDGIEVDKKATLGAYSPVFLARWWIPGLTGCIPTSCRIISQITRTSLWRSSRRPLSPTYWPRLRSMTERDAYWAMPRSD